MRNMAENIEYECWGLDYERYALGKTLQKLTKKYSLESILELPAGGVKAMPSIYSIGFGLAGAEVTMINGVENSVHDVWKRLGIENLAKIHKCDDITKTGLQDSSYDFVWNFASFSTLKNPDKVFEEMIRLSDKYVAIFTPNSLNPGYLSHRTAHFLAKVPWSHGDVTFWSPRKTKKFFLQHGLKIKKIGVLDCPPWPDSVGFRDIRLHKMNIDLSTLNWHSRYIDYLAEDNYPAWIRAVSLFESIPIPLLIKYFYSHLFYIIGEK